MTEQKPFILCIDDDKTSRFILQTIFTRSMTDVDVEIWSNSIDFEERIASISKIPQLIIMAIIVKPLDGYEMFNIVRKNERFQNTKIVAYTAGVMPEQVRKMKSTGFEGLISKPIVRQLFPQIVYSLLAGESIWYIS